MILGNGPDAAYCRLLLGSRAFISLRQAEEASKSGISGTQDASTPGSSWSLNPDQSHVQGRHLSLGVMFLVG